MEIKNNEILFERFSIDGFIKENDDLYIYSAVDTKVKKNNEINIIEYVPESSDRDEDGMLIIESSKMATFESMVENIKEIVTKTKDHDINKYIKCINFFEQNGTIYIVNKIINGEMLREYNINNEKGYGFTRVIRIFLELLEIAIKAQKSKIYFNYNLDNIYLTNGFELRLGFWPREYSENEIANDFANMLYYLLLGSDLSSKITEEEKTMLSEKQINPKILKIIDVLENNKFNTLNELNYEIVNIYQSKNYAEDAKFKDKFLAFIAGGTFKTVFFVTLIVILILTTMSIISFSITKMIIQDPFNNTMEEETIEENYQIELDLYK